MYLSIPKTFLVPVCYLEEDILNNELVPILNECNSDIDFINKITNRKQLVIGISLPSEKDPIWSGYKEYMEKYAESQGAIVKVENADNNAERQVSQVENLISQGIDILIIAPVDSVVASSIVEKAHKAGIKVVAFDRIIENSDLDMYISTNGTRIGELQGRFLTQKVPKGNYIIMSGDPRDNNAKLLKDGAMKYIQPLVNKGDIKIVTDAAVDDWDPKNAFKIVEESLIANNNKINAILAPNDGTAGGAIEALQAQGLAGKVAVTGQDGELAALQRIVQGTQLMTVFKDPKKLGKATIDTAIKVANGESIDISGTVNNGKIYVPSIFVTPIAIDKNNIDSELIDSGYFKKEQVYKM
ncbi:sugar ABC transporter substrate-binding protein [Clostridium uliginosum]|uniref:D-xylose transport system substrate-binding protein n=1 Tax=Clostridium uliginosum TaxID=119641 RepID=A0A1I1S2G8_9CLOT|nr:substrate-binding domain-containing protein [Clostridium uliginosum]SFD40557.1 D-xylose transport system substrate-binding protein [Clostridium uliginosum]